MGMPGVPWQILEDQLTLSQPGPPEGRLCPPNITGTPGLSDLPTALKRTSQILIGIVAGRKFRSKFPNLSKSK